MVLIEYILLFQTVLCIALAFAILAEKRSNVKTVGLMVSRNIELGKQLDLLRTEMAKLNDDIITLVRENHILNLEVQTLSMEVTKLREEMSKTKGAM